MSSAQSFRFSFLSFAASTLAVSTLSWKASSNSYPNTVRVSNKENCVLKHKTIVDYFNSLPTHIEFGQIFVDGCIEPSSNLFIRTMLRKPKTFYLMVTRDYADWI
eukprot:gene39969-49406_t